MRKFLLGLALLAPVSAWAQTGPYRGQSGYDVGPIINCMALDGAGTVRCLVPSVALLDASGVPLGTSTNPIYTTGGGGGSVPTGSAGSPNANVVTVQGITNGTPQNVAQSGAPWADNITQVGGSAITLGQKANAASIPVALSSDGTYATAANQATMAANQTNGAQIAKAFGVFNTTTPTVASGGQAQFNADSKGNIRALITASSTGYGPTFNTYGLVADFGGEATRYPLAVQNFIFDGSVGRPAMGDLTGTWTTQRGAPNLNTTQVSVGTTATLVSAARLASGGVPRSRLIITQSAAGPCYYGPTNTVSATTGARLTVAGASKTYNYSGALYGICPGGAVTTDVDEEY